MVYQYRISLAGLKGFARVYELSSDTTLYSFHKLLRDDLEFAHDQRILFKALDASGELVARYGLFDLGSGAADTVTLADTRALEVLSFNYFYDVTNRKSVIITFEGEKAEEPGIKYPVLIESKGPNPIEFENGYVAFEDLPKEKRKLPDDDDDPALDDDEEDNDDDADSDEDEQ